MPSKIVREYDKHLYYLFLLLLLWAPIPLGSNRPWSAMLLVFLSAALLSLWLLLFLKEKVQITPSIFRARWALICLVCFQAWIFLQIIPLPTSWVAVLSSTAFSQYQFVTHSEFIPLSVSNDSGLKDGVLGIGLLFSFLLTLLLVNTQERKQIFFTCLVISGVIQAIVGLVMVFVDHEIILNIEQLFHEHKNAASSTFVNSNHFAGYINICLALGIGLLISQFNSQKHSSWQAQVRAAIATLLSPKMRLRIYLMILVIALLVSRSRMGNFAFFAALSLTTLIFLFASKKFNLKLLMFFISLMVVDTFLVGTWFGFDKVVEEVEKTNLSNEERTETNKNSKQLISQYGFIGAGSGAYKYIEPESNTSPSVALTEHAHNDYYQFFIETGALGFSFLLLFLYCVVRALKQNFNSRVNQGETFGITMLLIYLAIHSLVDFNLQIPAFSFTLLACLAMVFVNTQNTNQSKITIVQKASSSKNITGTSHV